MLTKLSNWIISACWLIYVIYWTASARRVKTVAERQSTASIIGHRARIAVGLLLILLQKPPGPLALAVTPQTPVVSLAGAALCVVGLFVAIWARRTLGANWSSSVTFKQDHELIQTGPYHFVRHPIYTGILSMLLGSVLLVGRLHAWLGFLLICVAVGIKLKQEELLMSRHFPDQYPGYRRRVKALLPFVI